MRKRARAVPRVLARDRISIIAKETGLDESFVRQVIFKLKTDGRIAASRPVAPAMTAGDLARILLGLAAPLPSRATEIERRLGRLPRFSGDGAETADGEIAALVEAAVSAVDDDIDFRRGDILLGVTNPSVTFNVERPNRPPAAMSYRQEKSPPPAGGHFCPPANPRNPKNGPSIDRGINAEKNERRKNHPSARGYLGRISPAHGST
jgi:hypothetical protein